MGLFGRHSRNPNGNPEVLAAMRSATPEQLRVIARGGVGSLGKWTNINWGQAHGRGDEREEERAYAAALLAGNTAAADNLSQAATAGHRDWDGGTLAKMAPLAAAFIPGIGPLAAAAIGAGIGGATAATGLDNRSIGSGLVRGAAQGGIGKVALNGLTGGAASGGAASAGTPLSASTAGVANASLPTVGEGALSAATSGVANASLPSVGQSFLSRAPMAVGRFLTNPANTPLVLGVANTAATVYGKKLEGDALDRQSELDQEAQNQNIDIARRRGRPQPRFADWQAARRAPGSLAPSY